MSGRVRTAVDRVSGGDAVPAWATVVVGVLLLALVAVTWAWRHAGADERAERDALAVARQRAAQITTYDHTTFERDVRWARSGATASFRREYAQANAAIGAAAKRLRASATGRVTGAAATAKDPDHVTVLLFVDQTLTRTGRGQQVQENRVRIDMVHRDGRWLVDDVRLS